MSTTANKLQTDIIKYLEKKGVFCWRQNNTATFDQRLGSYRAFAGMKGVPDVIAITPPTGKYGGGVFVGLEVKVGKDRMSTHQILFSKRCASNNAEYHVIKTLDDLKKLDHLWG